VTLVIIVFVAVSALLAMTFFGAPPLEEPSLKLELEPTPPWHVRLGNSFEVSIEIVNSASSLAEAKGVRAEVTAPEGFVISGTNKTKWNGDFGTLRGGDRRNDTLTVAVSSNVLPGNYNMTIRISGNNVPQQTLTPKVFVELPASLKMTENRVFLSAWVCATDRRSDRLET